MSNDPLKKSSKKRITLGNYYNLHTGYHNIFLENANKYFVFKSVKPRIICHLLKNQKHFHPATNPFYVETHKYANCSTFIQSAFFPVDNKKPWIVDMDDICLPLLGNTCFNKKLMRRLYKNYFKNPYYRKVFLARIGQYATPFCKGILFRSIAGIKDAISCFKSFDIYNTPEVKEFLKKIILAYPVTKLLIRKPKLHNPCTILFMARDFQNKGGNIALATFEKLYKYNPHLKLIYCGPIPIQYQKHYLRLLSKLSYYSEISHKQALFLLKKSDILILPTQFEGLGITLIEAKAAGCIPVTYHGQALGAMKEIIKNYKTGILIRKPYRLSDEKLEAQKFFNRVRTLLSKEQLLVRMKKAALKEVTKGKFSFAKRLLLLRKIFRTAKDPLPTLPKKNLGLEGRKTRSYRACDYNKLLCNFRVAHNTPRRILIKGNPEQGIVSLT